MYKKTIKQKNIFYLFRSILLKRKKNILFLGPIGNYSYNTFIKIINKKYFLFPIKSINFLFLNFTKLIPFENNNGGIVRDTLNLMYKKKIFIKNILILNIKHNFFIYKKKKIINLHKQSYKQIKKNVFFLKKVKFNLTNSNSIINNGLNICNFTFNKIFYINIKKIFLKENLINKTKFIINNVFNKKKNIICVFINNFIFINNILKIYKKKKNYYLEIFVNSFKKILFIMKYFKNKTKINIVGYYFIL